MVERIESMKLGLVVDGPWGFIRELLADWRACYQTRVFSFKEINLPVAKGRVNQWRLRQALERFLAGNDLIFFEWAGPLLVTASHLETHAPLIVRLHSYELFDYAPFIRWESVRRVICVSGAMRQRFCELYPAAAAKATVVHNGVDLQRFAPRPRPFHGVIGMLGNLLPIKRVYEVILGLYELNRVGGNFTLRIAGPTERGSEPERYYLAMQRLVRQLGLKRQVSFVGPVSDPESFLRGVDIFVSNSYWEGQQVALLEAMATGCYCLAHAWEGVEEVLPREYLFVTDAELRERIERYCQAPEEVKNQHQARMRAIASEKFDIEQTKSLIRAAISKVGASTLR
jgi:glycosyltransferase involved in cell wall biosynthesis